MAGQRVSTAEIIEAYRTRSAEAVGRMYGISQSTVLVRLRLAGVEMRRSHGEAPNRHANGGRLVDQWAREIDSAPSPVMDDALTKCTLSIRRLHLQLGLPLADLP